jgi:hypothetical protein
VFGIRPSTLVILGTLLAAGGGAGGGCVVVPVPHPEYRVVRSRRPITQQDAAGIVPGTTSRADVLCILGEPDFWWDGERVVAYQWTTSNLGILWAVGAGGGCTGGFEDIPVNHFLVVTIDPAGRVDRFQFRDAPDGVSGRKFLRKLWQETP